MSRYNRPYLNPAAKPRPWSVHPVWRGIGCLLIILLPLISYAAAYLLVRENVQRRWVVMPDELLRSFSLPLVGRMYLADLAVAIGLLVVGFAALTVLYALFYRLFGPSRYGPLDVPPEETPRMRRR